MFERGPARLLLVDDDALFCTAISDLFANIKVEVVSARSLARARVLADSSFDVVILDDRLPDGRGLELLELFRPARPPDSSGARRPRVVVVSADPNIDMAIAALRHHVHDFLPKPIDLDALMRLVCAALAARAPIQASASAELGAPALDAELQRYAASDAPVLLRGETGTGKTRLARQLHAVSARAAGPFVAINCGALPEALVESELFGSERGAFTGAGSSRVGLIESAAGGTFFLDEIGELPLACQAKLLDVLETKCLRRVGGVTQRRVDLRFMAATHVDLEGAATSGRFRRDLLYRLDVLRIELPPLRSCPAALPGLISELMRELDIARPLAAGELERLAARRWLGNIRELRNLLQRASVLQPTGEFAPSALLELASREREPRAAPPCSTQPPTVEEVALRHMVEVAVRSPSRKHAAAALGIGESTLRRKLKQAAKLGLAPERSV